MNNKVDFIQSLINMTNELPHRDENRLDVLRRRARMIVRQVFGETSEYLQELDKIGFHARAISAIPNPRSERLSDEAWNRGKNQLTNLFNVMLEEISLQSRETTEAKNR
jgi:hypothetical protein